MAAPIKSFMLHLVKISSYKKPCIQSHNLMCKSAEPVRHLATTSFNLARMVRRTLPKSEDRIINSTDHDQKSNNIARSETLHVSAEDSQEGLQRNTIDSDSDGETEDVAYKLKYEKAGTNDKRIGRMMMLVKSRKYREQMGRVMIEGRRLINDAIESGVQAHTVFFSQLESLEGIPLHKTRAALIKIPFKDIAMWSDVVTREGVIGVFKKPTHENTLCSQPSVLPLTLICDNIRESGNLGTILRSAVAAQCQKILLTKGCVDLWEPKVLRSGAGAHFHMPIIANIPWKDVPNYLDEGTTVHVADNNISGAEPSTAVARRVPQPRKHDRKEAFKRKQMKDRLHEDNEDQVIVASDLESEVYYNINWQTKSALVIGGETEGLSNEALRICDESLGCRVHIPMAEAINSLNAAVSASVILFEALRQNLNMEKN